MILHRLVKNWENKNKPRITRGNQPKDFKYSATVFLYDVSHQTPVETITVAVSNTTSRWRLEYSRIQIECAVLYENNRIPCNGKHWLFRVLIVTTNDYSKPVNWYFQNEYSSTQWQWSFQPQLLGLFAFLASSYAIGKRKRQDELEDDDDEVIITNLNNNKKKKLEPGRNKRKLDLADDELVDNLSDNKKRRLLANDAFPSTLSRRELRRKERTRWQTMMMKKWMRRIPSMQHCKSLIWLSATFAPINKKCQHLQRHFKCSTQFFFNIITYLYLFNKLLFTIY